MTLHQSELHRQQEAWRAARARLATGKPTRIQELETELQETRAALEQARRDVIRLIAEARGHKAQVEKRDQEIARLAKRIRRLRPRENPVKRRNYPSIESIVAPILERYPDVTWADIIGKKIGRKFSHPRHECMCAVHANRPDMSFPEIARAFNRQCHTTVMHAVRKGQATVERLESAE